MRQHKLALCKEHYLEWIPTQVLLQVVAMFLGAVSQGSVAFNDVDYFFKRSFY